MTNEISLETALRVAGLEPEKNAYERDAEEERAHINGEFGQLGTIIYRARLPFGPYSKAEFCQTRSWVDADNSNLPMLIGELQELQRDVEDLTNRLLQDRLFIQRTVITPATVVDGARGYECRFGTQVVSQEELNRFVMTLAQYARETEVKE